MVAPTSTPANGLDLHPAFFVASWIFFSNMTIIFNKWILDTAGFPYPLMLTTLHLTVATILTQLMARSTPLLNSRKNFTITGRIYVRAILPIGLLYTASLACSNQTYLYLSVPFIQMLKALAPVCTLWISWMWGLANPTRAVLYNIIIITLGVVLSSLGEVKFSWLGFAFQMGGIVTESSRLLLIQVLLKGEGEAAGIKMDPLVGLYYYAPICAVLNGVVALMFELPTFQYEDFERVGMGMLLLNCMVAFMLNVASVFLIGKTSALTMNLTGIFKSILLVVASIMIWNTPITFMQSFGYAIALGGMFYYSMGKDAAGNMEKAKLWVLDNMTTSSGRSALVSSTQRWAQEQMSGGGQYNPVPTAESIEIQNQRTGDLEAGKETR